MPCPYLSAARGSPRARPLARSRAAAQGLLALLAACGGDSGKSAVRLAAPPGLEPALAELVEAQLAKIRDRPRDGGEVAHLALIYEANRQWAPAREAFDAAIALAPDEPLLAVHGALARTNLGDPEGARALLQARADRFSSCAPLQYSLGELALDAGDLATAGRAFERTTAAVPQQPEGYFGCGLVELRQGHADRARELFSKALALDSSFLQAWYPLGLALAALGREGEAEAAMERGREVRRRRMRDALNAQLGELAVTRDEVLERASAWIESGRADQAVAKLEALAKRMPDDALVHFNLGVAHWSARKPAEALAELERARSLDGSLAGLDANLALALLALRRPVEAQIAIQRAFPREERVARTQRILAGVSEALGDPATALRARQRAVELDPSDPAARSELGRTYAQAEQWRLAEEQFRAQAELAPQDWHAHSDLARVLYAQQRREEASVALGSARRAAGADPAAAQELAQIAKALEIP
jgi:tetratricopeptide (TPR) repeat protein